MQRSYLYTPCRGSRPYCTIPERLADLAKSIPDKEALVIIGDTGRVSVTYKEILENATEVAQKLLNLGIDQRDVIAIHDDRSPEWLYNTIGVQMCGAWPLHFYFERKDGKDLISLLKLAKCKVIICQPGEDDVYVKIMKHFLSFKRGGSVFSEDITCLQYVIFTTDPTSLTEAMTFKSLHVPATVIPLPEIEPEGIAAILGSSGSTMFPKLIPKSHIEMILPMITGFETSGMKEGGTVFNERPFSWIASYPVDILNRMKRITIHFMRSHRGRCQDILRIIQEERCDYAVLFQSTIKEMVRTCSTTNRINTIASGGGPISKHEVVLLERYCDRFICAYGTTEMGTISLNVLTNPEDMVNYDVGIPLPGVEIKIVDKNGAVLEKGKMGEIYVRTLLGSTGFLEKEQEWHKENRAPGYWFKTGDSGFITERGHLCVPGRVAESIIVDGKVIPPSFFEDIFKRHPCVENVVAFAIPDKKLHEIPGIAVEVQLSATVTEDTLRKFFIEQRNVYTEKSIYESVIIPKHIFIFDNFPKLATGKVARKDVKEKAMLMLR